MTRSQLQRRKQSIRRKRFDNCLARSFRDTTQSHSSEPLETKTNMGPARA